MCVGPVAIFSGTTQQLPPRTPLPTAAPVKAMTKTLFVKMIAEKTELKPKDVRAIFSELKTIAYAEVANTEKFVIPELNVVLKVKHKPAKKAGVTIMFGKEVKVAAKPAKKVVAAFPGRGIRAYVARREVYVAMEQAALEARRQVANQAAL